MRFQYTSGKQPEVFILSVIKYSTSCAVTSRMVFFNKPGKALMHICDTYYALIILLFYILSMVWSIIEKRGMTYKWNKPESCIPGATAEHGSTKKISIPIITTSKSLIPRPANSP